MSNQALGRESVIELAEYLKKPFDFLYAHTSNETDQQHTYADTRAKGGHFSVTSTQSSVSTYAACEAESARKVPGRLPRETETYDCEDPRTCPTCRPVATDD